MATNHTTNYALNLWEPTDNFVREEFNENTSKIDAALTNKIGRSEVIKVVEMGGETSPFIFDAHEIDWGEWETVMMLFTSPVTNIDLMGTVTCITSGPSHTIYSGPGGGLMGDNRIDRIRVIFSPRHDAQTQVDSIYIGNPTIGYSWVGCTYAQLGELSFNYHKGNSYLPFPAGTKITFIGRR